MAAHLNFHPHNEAMHVTSGKYDGFVTLVVASNDGNSSVTFFIRTMEQIVSFQKAINDAAKNLAENLLNVELSELAFADTSTVEEF